VRAPAFVPSLPLDAWPERDQEAWRRATTDDPLQPGGLGGASAWRPATHEVVRIGYGVWLSWLTLTGTLDPAADAAARAGPEMLREYLRAMRSSSYSDFSCAARLGALGSALRVMSPNVNTAFISRAAGRVAASARRTRDPQVRSRPPQEILELGDALMTSAGNEERDDVRRALLFRDGLILALIVHRPLRIANLAAIEIDRHLRTTEAGFRIQFEGAEMKARRPYGCQVPKSLVGPLKRYLVEFRPVLLSGSMNRLQSSALWIGRHGAGLKPETVAAIVRSRTTAAFGEGLGPHIMRHIIATMVAEHSPENVTEVAAILGHQSLETSHGHYIHARAMEAGYRLHKAIAARTAEHRKS